MEQESKEIVKVYNTAYIHDFRLTEVSKSNIELLEITNVKNRVFLNIQLNHRGVQ